jgi:hypothetical protein
MLGATVELPTTEYLAIAATAGLMEAAGITEDCLQTYGSRLTNDCPSPDSILAADGADYAG